MNNHFEKLPSELKRPLRRVKTTLLQKGRKLPLGVKTTFEFTVQGAIGLHFRRTLHDDIVDYVIGFTNVRGCRNS